MKCFKITSPGPHGRMLETVASVSARRILIVDTDNDRARPYFDAARTVGAEAHVIHPSDEVVYEAIRIHTPDLVIVNAAAVNAETLQEWQVRLTRAQPAGRFVITTDQPSFDQAIAALRFGAVDFLAPPLSPEALEERLRAALEAVDQERSRLTHVDRLKRLLQRINTSRLDVTSQIDTLCNDLVSAYQDLTEQIAHITVVTEFTAVIRQELDVEELLRAALEYFLRRFGAMNAAVFLPNSVEEFTLGAYVNYDCKAGNADVLLEHLGDIIAPKLAEESDVREFQRDAELQAWIGDDATWIADSHVIAFPCRHDGECLAIMLLFRDSSTPFPDDMKGMMNSISDIFARQLAHVIHIHHRHIADEPIDGVHGAGGGEADGAHDWDLDDDLEDEHDGGLAA